MRAVGLPWAVQGITIAALLITRLIRTHRWRTACWTAGVVVAVAMLLDP